MPIKDMPEPKKPGKDSPRDNARAELDTTQEILTLKELAALLRISLRAAYLIAGSGQIPTLKVGRSLRFDRTAVLEHLTQPAEYPSCVTGNRRSHSTGGQRPKPGTSAGVTAQATAPPVDPLAPRTGGRPRKTPLVSS